MIEHLRRVSPHHGWQAVTAAQAAALAAHEPAASSSGSGTEPPDWVAAGDALAAGDGLVMEEADARLRAAEDVVRGGRPEEARADVLVAWELLGNLGALALVPRATRIAASADVLFPRPARSERTVASEAGEEVLTPREREVLHLVALGRSNRAIAEALFISVNTVSVHVSNILAELRVSSRTEAAAWAHAHQSG